MPMYKNICPVECFQIKEDLLETRLPESFYSVIKKGSVALGELPYNFEMELIAAGPDVKVRNGEWLVLFPGGIVSVSADEDFQKAFVPEKNVIVTSASAGDTVYIFRNGKAVEAIIEEVHICVKQSGEKNIRYKLQNIHNLVDASVAFTDYDEFGRYLIDRFKPKPAQEDKAPVKQKS